MSVNTMLLFFIIFVISYLKSSATVAFENESHSSGSYEELEGYGKLFNYILAICPNIDQWKIHDPEEVDKTEINVHAEAIFMKSVCRLAHTEIAAAKGYLICYVT